MRKTVYIRIYGGACSEVAIDVDDFGARLRDPDDAVGRAWFSDAHVDVEVDRVEDRYQEGDDE